MNIEDVTKTDILDALDIIKTVCYNNVCEFCPFGGSGYCHIKAGDPENWDIKETVIWRAFK